MTLKRSALLSFLLLISAVFLVGAITQYFAQLEHPVVPPTFLRVDPRMKSFLHPEVKSAAAAKRKKLFWMESSASDSHAVDVLASPRLFSSLFPGYPEQMRTDADLWRDYFHRPFETDVFGGEIALAFGAEFRLVMSWIGCVDIYRRYGADVVVIGTSETFRSVVVDQLSLKLGRDARVLDCAGAALQFDSAKDLAERLQNARPDLRPTVLLGISEPIAFVEGRRNRNNAKEKRETLALFDFQQARSGHALIKFFEENHEISFADLFPKYTWDDVFPNTYFSLLENERLAGYPALASASSPQATKGGYVSSSFRKDPTKLAQDIERRLKPYYRVYDDYEDQKHCKSEERVRQLDELGGALKKLSDRIFVFIPPTTPLAFEAATACFRNQVKKDVEAFATRLGAKSRTGGWDSYGLDYTDYMRPSSHPEVDRIDIQHANFKGASRITSVLGDWMREGAK